MDRMPISVVVLGSIPEAMLMVWAGFLLLGIKPPRRKMLMVGVLQGISSYFIRRYFDFGPHMIAHMITFIFYSYAIIGANMPTTVLAIALAFTVVVMVEGPILIFGNINIAYMLSSSWKRLLFFLPHEILLGLIIYFCSRKEISLVKEFAFLKKIVG